MTERLDAGTIVDGRYKIERRLGTGGMADVYCAEDLQLGRNVALKLLHSRFAEDAEFVERFRREASSAAGLQHPNVVGVYDRGDFDGGPYIAMEFVEGRTLKELIVGEGPLDPGRAVDFTIQILRAARFAHKRGIIHRDLKPQNVIADADGRLKVTDFGIARAESSEMTQTGSIMGTAQYLSPEQAQGLPVSAQSDLYSVGIILYEMLCAHVPFEGDSAVAIALKQVNEAPVPPSQLNATVTPELEAVVLTALAKDAANRYADADAFIAALEQAKVSLRLTDPGNTVIIPGGAEAVAAAADVPVMSPEGYAFPSEPLPPGETEDDKRRRWWIALGVGLAVVAIIIGALLLFGDKKSTVPPVVGSPTAQAQQTLRDAGFSVELVPQTSDAPKDTVIAQDPKAGVKAEEGTQVRLTISSGPGEAAVPDVTGVGQNAARTQLEDAGFRVLSRTENSTSIKKNRVIETDPPASTMREKNTLVTMVVSDGPRQVAVPDVGGDARADARSTLEDAGFSVSVTTREDDTRDAGTVLSQSPAAGRQADEGSTVRITVAKAPEQVAVPDVVGDSQGDATTTLSAAGFTVVVATRAVTSSGDNGNVVAMSPAGGSRQKRGARITITIGTFTAPTNTSTTDTTGDDDGDRR